MYSHRSRLIIGFHGTTQEAAEEVITGKTTLKPSKNDYDWLGHGIYFWENSLSRASAYAQESIIRTSQTLPMLPKPSVLGAVIDLGNCLDLLDYENLGSLKDAFEIFCQSCQANGIEIPSNRISGNSNDLLLRHLDCAVIETLHSIR